MKTAIRILTLVGTVPVLLLAFIVDACRMRLGWPHLLCVAGGALALVATAQAPAPGVRQPAAAERQSDERADLKIVKVLSAKDGAAVFRAYTVKWKGQDVVVQDTFVQTDYQAGDTVSVVVTKLPHPDGKLGLLSFHMLAFKVFPGHPRRAVPEH